MIKRDVNIGYRAAECVRARWKTLLDFEADTGIKHKLVHNWTDGMSPSAQTLQAMCEAGIDVVYILTGRLQDE